MAKKKHILGSDGKCRDCGDSVCPKWSECPGVERTHTAVAQAFSEKERETIREIEKAFQDGFVMGRSKRKNAVAASRRYARGVNW